MTQGRPVQRLHPTLWFAAEAADAAAFYCAIFPDSRIVRTMLMPPGGPAEEGAVLVVEFDLFGQRISALNTGTEKAFNEAVSMTILCDTQDEIDRYWEALLADGGEEIQCGWLKDRFGLHWQIVPAPFFEMLESPDREAAGRAMVAMMGMVKLDIAALRAAFDNN